MQRVNAGAAAAAAVAEKVHVLQAAHTTAPGASSFRCEVKHRVRCGVGAVARRMPLEAKQRRLQHAGRHRSSRSQRNQRKEERHKRQRHAATKYEAAEGGEAAGAQKRPPVGAPPPLWPLTFCCRTFHCHLGRAAYHLGVFWMGGECGRVRMPASPCATVGAPASGGLAGAVSRPCRARRVRAAQGVIA